MRNEIKGFGMIVPEILRYASSTYAMFTVYTYNLSLQVLGQWTQIKCLDQGHSKLSFRLSVDILHVLL